MFIAYRVKIKMSSVFFLDGFSVSMRWDGPRAHGAPYAFEAIVDSIDSSPCVLVVFDMPLMAETSAKVKLDQNIRRKPEC